MVEFDENQFKKFDYSRSNIHMYAPYRHASLQLQTYIYEAIAFVLAHSLERTKENSKRAPLTEAMITAIS